MELDYLKKYDIQKKINSFSKKYKNKKIVIYGAGKLSEYIFKNYNLEKLNITAVADIKYEKLQNQTFYNIKCISPKEINNIEYDCILVFNLDIVQIINYLDDFVLKNKEAKIEWILKQNIFDFIKNKYFRKPTAYKKDKKYIFTFWEPKSKIPAYVDLCIKTWKKFLPDYEIVVLDYGNLSDWLGFEFFDKYLYTNFSLPKQADAIRAAVLNKYGGIWIDADTIITSDKIRDVINKKSDTVMFNVHVCFISSKKKSKVTGLWLKEIKRNIFLHKIYNFSRIFSYCFSNIRFIAKMNNWNYLGNLIVNKIRENTDEKEFLSLERMEYFALPEENYYSNTKATGYSKYIEFYFKNDFSNYVFENEKGIICLHNSWTPYSYMKMTKEEFLKQNCTLAKILKKYNEE